MSAIALDRLSKTFGRSVALRDLTLDVAQGEFLTILGPSGSGKSTALSLISGLAQPSSGTIHLAGRDVTQLAPARRNIGLVFQSYALFPHLNLRDNVAFPLRVRKTPAADVTRRVDEIIGLLRLGGLEDRKPSQLSGGQQQRVALARALVFGPDILLLDEPMGALDKKLREDVQVELRRLHKRLGTTTILVTHDQEEALSLSDRILVLADGHAEQVGTPREVYTRPANAFVAGFLGTANQLRGRLRPRDAGGLELVVDGGHSLPLSLPLAPHAGAAGAEVVVIARPETARILPDDPSSPGIPGKIRDAIYLGTHARYHVETSFEEPLIVSSTDPRARHAPGDPVRIGWSPDDLWVLPTPASQP
ncbi:MAG TPA: ABC transporter ATP-binding protein [Burkholderiaceae bacterium]